MNKLSYLLLEMIEKYSKLIFILIVLGVFSGYYGIYALTGHKVILRTEGMIFLSTETSLINILLGLALTVLILEDKEFQWQDI